MSKFLTQKQTLQNIANTMRCLAIEAVSNARSGHLGMAMGCAEFLAYLYGFFMQYHPQHTNWVNRDRLILSAGHGSISQTILLHMAGYDITIDDIKRHRQGSIKASSHPLYDPSVGIETTTGADGYGVANAVGMALGQEILKNQYYSANKKLFNEKIVVIAGDSCMMEGISYEAAQIAGHFQLKNFILVYDYNKVTLDGYIDEVCSTDYVLLYQSLGFDVFTIDGHDLDAIHNNMEALRLSQEKPTLIILNTCIGRGIANIEGTVKAHGSNILVEQVRALTNKILPDYTPWSVSKEIYNFFAEKHRSIAEYIILKKNHNINIDIVEGLLQNLPLHEQSGRFLSQEVLNKLAEYIPQIISGSADSAHSDGTHLRHYGNMSFNDYTKRNIKFGVREFAMCAIANGLAQTGEIIPVIGGFLAFSDYLKPALRFAAMMKLRVICSFSHDSIFLGEDGPTHQPVEQLTMFRATPNTLVIRPADSEEVKFAWILALKHQGPTILALSRQILPSLNIERNFSETGARGAYIISDDFKAPDIVIYASGSEIYLALQIKTLLSSESIITKVVSVLSFEIFMSQDDVYKKKILDHGQKLSVSIEAGHSMPWLKFTGSNASLHIAVEEFGLSDSQEMLAEHFGFTVNKIAEKIIKALKDN